MRKVVAGEKHSTASVWIISKTTPKKILLVHHKKYNKWIQPGGHVEKHENPMEAAVREVEEETGIDISFITTNFKQTKDGITNFLKAPNFLLEQKISAHGQDPDHFHLDHQYVVEIGVQILIHNTKESMGIGWFTKNEALKLPIHEDTKIIIQKLLNQ